MSFSAISIILALLCIAFIYLTPLLCLIPIFIRQKSDDALHRKISKLSLYFLELPILILVIVNTLYFSLYDRSFSFLDDIPKVVPYILIFWYIYYIRKEPKKPTLKKIMWEGWFFFLTLILIQDYFLFKDKAEIERNISENRALHSGDKKALDTLWKGCPENIDNLFFNISTDARFNYPETTYDKLLDCEKKSNNYSREYLTNLVFKGSPNTNLISSFYKDMTFEEREALKRDTSVIRDRIEELKRCGPNDKCSAQILTIINRILQLEPSWHDEININSDDLHNAIMYDNEVSIKYYLQFIAPVNIKDKIAMAVVFSDNEYVTTAIKNKKLLLSNYGEYYNQSISMLKFIIMNGTEEMINFIIDNPDIDMSCYVSASTINSNSKVSSEFNSYYNNRLKNKKCNKEHFDKP